MNNEVINKHMIFLDKNIDNRNEVIDYILNMAYNLRLIYEIAELKQSIVSREKEISTAIGYNIAMPHGKSRVVKNHLFLFWEQIMLLGGL